MTDQVTIRKGDTTDIPVIRTLAHVIWPDTYGNILSPAQLNYMIDLLYAPAFLEKQFDQQHIFLMAEMNAEIVGFASYAHGEKAGMYKIHKLYVHPMVHSKGIGKKLMNTIIADVKASGATAVKLNVNRQNPARTFYEKYGFVVCGEEDIAIGEGYFMNDYIMELNV